MDNKKEIKSDIYSRREIGDKVDKLGEVSKTLSDECFKFIYLRLTNLMKKHGMDLKILSKDSSIDTGAISMVGLEYIKQIKSYIAKYNIVVNERFWGKMTDKDKVKFFLHELSHFSRGHIEEALKQEYNNEIFNRIADSVINYKLGIYQIAGIEGWVYPFSLYGEGGIFNNRYVSEFEMMKDINNIVKGIMNEIGDLIKKHYEVEKDEDVKRIVELAIFYDFTHLNMYRKQEPRILLYDAIKSNYDINEILKKVPKRMTPPVPPPTPPGPPPPGTPPGVPVPPIDEPVPGTPIDEPVPGTPKTFDHLNPEELTKTLKEQLRELKEKGVNIKKILEDIQSLDPLKVNNILNELQKSIDRELPENIEMTEEEKEEIKKIQREIKDYLEEVRKDIKQEINNKITPSGGVGFGHGGFVTEIENVYPLYIHELIQILRRIKSEFFHGSTWSRERTYRRPGRTPYYREPDIKPYLRGTAYLPKIKILCAFDISGSISHYAPIFVGIADGLREKYKVTVATFSDFLEIKKDYEAIGKLRGYAGGTAISPVMEETINGKYDAVIILTDADITTNDANKFFKHAMIHNFKGKIMVLYPEEYEKNYNNYIKNYAEKYDFDNNVIPIPISKEVGIELKQMEG